jgi:hypothetical protein
VAVGLLLVATSVEMPAPVAGGGDAAGDAPTPVCVATESAPVCVAAMMFKFKELVAVVLASADVVVAIAVTEGTDCVERPERVTASAT